MSQPSLWHGYMGIENLAMNDAQRNLLYQNLGGLGQKNDGNSEERIQVRIRNDKQAGIFEAVFERSNLTPNAIKQELARIFGLPDASSISHRIVTADFGNGTTQFAIFTRNSIDYLRLGGFGGITATWEESREEALIYLDLHDEEWNAETIS